MAYRRETGRVVPFRSDPLYFTEPSPQALSFAQFDLLEKMVGGVVGGRRLIGSLGRPKARLVPVEIGRPRVGAGNDPFQMGYSSGNTVYNQPTSYGRRRRVAG